jgi:hypothetical protein
VAIDSVAAEQILIEAKSDGFFKGDIPTDEAELLKAGQSYYDHAKKEFDAGMPGADVTMKNSIQKIVFIGDTAELEARQDNIAGTYPRRSSGGLSESDEREWDSFLEREKLPIPGAIEGDADPMPRDLSETSDKDIRRLSGEYNAFLGRATYLLSFESASLIQAEHLLNAAKSVAIKALPASDKKRTLKEIDSLILDVPDVKEWTEKVMEHEKKVAVLKGLKEIYSGNVSVLSREWTMRQNEWEKGR